MRPLPLALANVVNTLRSDIDEAGAKAQAILRRSSETRQADDRGLNDVLDELKAKITARVGDWLQTGTLREVVGLAELETTAPKQGQAPLNFPQK